MSDWNENLKDKETGEYAYLLTGTAGIQIHLIIIKRWEEDAADWIPISNFLTGGWCCSVTNIDQGNAHVL